MTLVITFRDTSDIERHKSAIEFISNYKPEILFILFFRSNINSAEQCRQSWYNCTFFNNFKRFDVTLAITFRDTSEIENH